MKQEGVGVAGEEGTRIYPQGWDMNNGNLSTESNADRHSIKECQLAN